MKNYSSILKLLALILSAVAVICLLVANLEAIMDTMETLCGKAKGKFGLCRSCEWDDELDDWDDEDEYEEWDL